MPQPVEFLIDADICMNCGFCAEYCPFDAIKMDHDFEIASYGRNVYNMEKLLKSSGYYKSIRPLNYAREEAARFRPPLVRPETKPLRKGDRALDDRSRQLTAAITRISAPTVIAR